MIVSSLVWRELERGTWNVSPGLWRQTSLGVTPEGEEDFIKLSRFGCEESVNDMISRALFIWDRERARAIMKSNAFFAEFVWGLSKSAQKSQLCWCGFRDEELALDNRAMEGKQKYTSKPVRVCAYLSCLLRSFYHFEKIPDRNSAGSGGWFCPLYRPYSGESLAQFTVTRYIPF